MKAAIVASNLRVRLECTVRYVCVVCLSVRCVVLSCVSNLLYYPVFILFLSLLSLPFFFLFFSEDSQRIVSPSRPASSPTNDMRVMMSIMCTVFLECLVL